MAKDWLALAARYNKEAAKTGISVKDWCNNLGISVNTARRHIKPIDVTIKTSSDQSDQNDQLAHAKKLKNQDLTDLDNNTTDHKTNQNPSKKPKRAASLGNQNARIYGHYSEFITTQDDIARYVSSGSANLTDELHLTRTQLSNVMIGIRRVQELLDSEELETDQEILLHQNHVRYQTIADKKTAHIITLETALESILTQQCNRLKIVESTRKTKLEADKIAAESGSSDTPLSKIYDEILAMDDNGMMNS